MAYAETTTVSVERSRAEIERLLYNHGSQQIQISLDYEHGLARVEFRLENRVVRFDVTLPRCDDPAFQTGARGRSRTDSQIIKAVEQAERQRWRALFLVVKAKLEAVESEISTFEQEFLAFILLPNGRTIGEVVSPRIEGAYAGGKMAGRLLTEGMPG